MPNDFACQGEVHTEKELLRSHRRDKISIILHWLMPDDFTRQRDASQRRRNQPIIKGHNPRVGLSHVTTILPLGFHLLGQKILVHSKDV